jgi:lysine biosynthesis protein LysW
MGDENSLDRHAAAVLYNRFEALGGECMATCPECDAEIEIDDDDLEEMEVGDPWDCDACGSTLRIASLDPLELEGDDEDEDDDDDEDDDESDEESSDDDDDLDDDLDDDEDDSDKEDWDE